ncbi:MULTISPECIES: fimbria/pilus outer membrane usher protein [unclassified Pantoea]|uniref:fimbria/pilus outer membrane usher protein n=1 Tax=unclassified Pantoea TaxID=2630326 RepID=UPI001CD61870|nr:MULTISPECIES: fimbria/pilus outer membrane usher protein [unclassified Pantoea]MCA1176401.1 fimbrial biogenesis outer membrane usher protein [Pantoea sp. alder69]MCA1249371.1 fimbrial biogenesis outer membrane usher protein [Pantoea sp. alder70]MCA1264554.1 fimbrial biogenesis outer membrane usher protein [Pantoea sp. alder81]
MKTNNNHTVKLSLLTIALLQAFSVSAEEAFNTSFIHGDAATVSELATGDDILPGRYPFDIYLNGQRVDHRDVVFRKPSPEKAIAPCLSAEQLIAYGVDLTATTSAESCVDLANTFKDASVSYDAAVQRVDLSVPQVFLIPVPKGAISPLVYDNGINAAFVNYNFNSSDNRLHDNGSQSSSQYYYLSSRSGVNLGRWRVRNTSTWQKQSGERSHWTPISTWAETDIIAWRSRLLLGQSSTSNSVFDSFQFRGAQLSSVSEILPDSLRGYAPVIRGVARTNARVDVQQNGYTVYSATVAPGPFALNDVYPSTLSGDLQVTIYEADGSRQHYAVPFSSVSNMLREGIWDYAFTLGRYQDGSTTYHPQFVQATLSRGLPYEITPYGGVLFADHYSSAVLGMGKSLGMFGAASFDTAWSKTDLANGDQKQGASFRFLYSKSLNTLGTELQIAGYRYSTSGYYDFSDMVAERANYENGRYRNDYTDTSEVSNGVPSWADTRRNTYYTNQYNNKRQRLELTINQHIGPVSVYASMTNQTYWGSDNRDRTLQTGLNSSWGKVNYGVFLQDTQSNYGEHDRSVSLTLSVPFNAFENQPVTATFNLADSKQSGSSYNTGLSGSLLDDNRLNYYVQTGKASHAGQTSTADVGYMGSMGNAELGYTYSDAYQQTNLNLSGGALLHSGGLTLTQPLQNTVVLVEAKEAQGVRLENQPGVAINRSGYAVMTSATAYHHNRVALRTDDIGADLDIPLAVKDVVPTYGAISRVTFETRSGKSALIHAQLPDGDVPAIGASVFNQNGSNLGVVGTNGSTFVSGVASGERLQLRWGSSDNEHCWITLPELGNGSQAGYQEFTLRCTPN